MTLPKALPLLCLAVLLAPACTPAAAEASDGNSLRPLPWILEMMTSEEPLRDLRERSCETCGDLNPLGSMCCGMCDFWVCVYTAVDMPPCCSG